MGALIRRPANGSLITVQVETDGVNGGTIELWDMDGRDAGAAARQPGAGLAGRDTGQPI
jgi:hypothetical protein